MADMKIAMTLTMADLASPEIQKFKANLAQLEKYLKGVGDSFKSATGGIADMGKVAADAASGITRVTKATGDMATTASRSSGSLAGLAKTLMQAESETAALWQSSMIMNKEALKSAFTFEKAAVAATEYDASVTPLGATLARVATETQAAIASTLEMNQAQLKSIFTYEKAEVAATEYDASVTRIGATLQAVAAQTQEMIAATMTMDKNMLNAAFAATGLGDKSLAAGSKIAAMGDDVAVADAKMSHMHGTMKGMMELMGAFKLAEGIGGAVKQASTYQQTMMMLKMRNLPGSQVTALASGAKSLSNTIPLLNRNEALEAELAAQPGLPGQSAFSKNMRAQLLPGVTRLGLVAGTFGDTASMTHRVQNIFGIIEALGGAENLARAKMILQDVRGGIVASHGKLDVRSIETALRTTNPGIRTNMNSTEFQKELALQEEMKAAGGGGSGGNTRIATLMNNIFMAANKGLMAKGAAVVMETLGLLNPADVHKYGKSSYYAALNPGALKGSQIASQSPAGYVQQYLLPALTHFGQRHWKQFGYTSNTAAAFSNPTQIGRANAEAAAYLASFRMGGQQFAGGLGLIGNPSVMAAVNSQVRAQHRAVGLSSQQDLQLRLNTAAGAAQKLDAQFANLGIQIGTALLPALTKLANGVSFVTHAITDLNSHFPVFSKIEAWVGALAALLLGIKGVEWLIGIRDGFSAIKAVKLGGTLAVWAAKAVLGEDAIAGLAAGIGGLGAAIAGLALPITLAVAAIGAMAYSAYQLYNYFSSGPPSDHSSLGIKAGHTHWANSKALGLGIKPGTSWGSTPTDGPAEAAGRAAYEQALKAPVLPGSLISRMGSAPSGAAIAKHAKETHDHLTSGQNKLAAAFHKRIDDALKFQKHLQHVAEGIHTAYQGIFDPISGKIPAIQAKYRAISGYLLTNGHTKAAQEALAVGHHQVLGLQYKAAMAHLSNLQRTLHVGTTDNAALQKTGVLTHAEAAQRNILLQRQMAPQMQKAAEAALKYAEALKDPALVAALKEQLANIGAMGKQLGYYGTKFKQSLQSSFTGLFNNLMHGQKTLGQSFAAFFASIGKSLENQLSKSLSQSITDAIMGKHKTTGLGSLFGGISSLLGLGNGSSSSSSNPFAGAAILGSSAFKGGGSSWLSGAGGIIKDITSIAGLFGFASGADNIPRDMVANIHKGEMIIPASGASLIRSGQAGIGGGGGNHVHMTIHAMDSQSVIGALHSVRHEAAQMFINTASSMNLQGG